MYKVFIIIKILFSILIMLAVLNDFFAYFYFDFVWQNFSDFFEVLVEITFFLLAGYLVYKDHFIGDLIICTLAFQSLNTIYQATPHLYSLAWLKTGPQILFSNILMTALIIVAIAHFILSLFRKAQTKIPKA